MSPTFVVMKWKGPPPKQKYLSGSRKETAYGEEQVNRIYSMLQKIYQNDFRLICVTDDAEKVRREVEVFPIPEGGSEIIRDYGGRFFKLFLFSSSFHEYVRDPFIYLDLDSAICGDLSDFIYSDYDLVIMRGYRPNPPPVSFRAFLARLKSAKNWNGVFGAIKNPRGPWCSYNSSFMAISPFIHNEIWSNLNLPYAQKMIQESNLIGTDQAYLHLHYPGSVQILGEEHGIWHFSKLSRYMAKSTSLPEGIKLVVFPGAPEKKPWVHEFREEYPWVRDLYPD